MSGLAKFLLLIHSLLRHIIFLLLCTLLCCSQIRAQDLGNLRARTIPWPSEALLLDSMVVSPTSLNILGKDTLDRADYGLSDDGYLSISLAQNSDSLRISYRVLPFKYQVSIATKDTALIRPVFEFKDPFAYSPNSGGSRQGLVDLRGFDKRGSISRGVQIGNAQDLSVNSDLNLQLSGKLTDKISLLANISDDNIPIQPDGSTQQLQEFDQVYVKLFTERASLTAGDYQLKSRRGYFSRYLKKARGANFEWEGPSSSAEDAAQIHLRAGAAISRGRFARNVIPGLEGNQGPYKLRGADGELFVIVLSGTERVYIDGQLLTRGKEHDYIVDYNAAEISFTANQLITKDKRIVVEFQYTLQSYARSLLQFELGYDRGPWTTYFNAYSEQDAKNQSLQQELSPQDRALLSAIGDDLTAALASDLDSVAFSEDAVQYALVDSLGYDSVFRFSSDPDLARFTLSFTRVGAGNGDYREASFSPNGRVFEWVAPDTVGGVLLRNGDYIPGVILVTPKVQRMFSAGLARTWDDGSQFGLEMAFSEQDLNAFSQRDSQDDVGSVFRVTGAKPFKLDSTRTLSASAMLEYTDRRFTFIERYRPVEFERNWNITAADLESDVLQTRIQLDYHASKQQRINYELDRLSNSSTYTGLRHQADVNWVSGPWHLAANGSFLTTDNELSSEFQRHAIDVSRAFGQVKLGFKDLREENRFRQDSLLSASYRWYQWEAYLQSGDTSNWNYRGYFRQRDDWGAGSERLLSSAHADEYGLELRSPSNKAHTLRLIASWRELGIVRDDLIQAAPEETFLGRLEYGAKLLDGIVRSQTFYEVGSGLERRKQFVFIEVPAGQGAYVWVDYNGDGVRDLDEFELAQFQYEADFIRVFTPTDIFERVFSNQFAQTLTIDPGRKWRKAEGLRGFLARFSDQASWRAERKTLDQSGQDAFNPFIQDLDDDVILALNSSLRNSVFFNKTDPKWSLDHVFNNLRSKQLLTNGFESRSTLSNTVSARYTIARKYTFRISAIAEERYREATYSANRNYRIEEFGLRPSIEWQLERTFRLVLSSAVTDREDQLGEGSRAEIINAGLEARYSNIEKGTINARVEYVQIAFDGNDNTPLAFEMLDGLKNGQNMTWSVYLQRNLSKNLELNLTYDGRKSESSNTIHAGGVQVRAFF